MSENQLDDFIDRIKRSAKLRGDLVLTDEIYEAALIAISTGEPCQRYPNGTPSLKDVQRVALKIHLESAQCPTKTLN